MTVSRQLKQREYDNDFHAETEYMSTAIIDFKTPSKLFELEFGGSTGVPVNIRYIWFSLFALERKYTGFIKLKQNWDDGLQKKTNPKTLILAGNIETAVRIFTCHVPDSTSFHIFWGIFLHAN